jgi:hypothetical protein
MRLSDAGQIDDDNCMLFLKIGTGYTLQLGLVALNSFISLPQFSTIIIEIVP